MIAARQSPSAACHSRPVMRYGSACSGIEAASAAWHHLGWRPVFFSEIEPFPRALLAERWPGVPIHGDFTTIEKDTYDPIDLLVCGTPCQDFSVAGRTATATLETGARRLSPCRYRKKPAADGPRYRALGNSMAVPCMRWIGERIAMVEELL
jgi:site-specific DNA-cytosine methylase